MPEAPIERPERFELLFTGRGHLAAKPKAVFDALDSRLRPPVNGSSYYTADRSAFFIVAQGGWWYRAEYRIVPDEFGSNLEHSLLNVAQKAASLGRFTGRAVIRDAPGAFETLLRQLKREVE